MAGSADRPPDLIAELRKMRARIYELESRLLNRIAASRQFAEETAEVSTTLAGPVDLGGPSITVTTPADAFVSVFAEGELRATAGDADVYLYEPTLLPSGALMLIWGTSTYTRVFSAGAFASTTSIGSPLIVPAGAGTWTFSFRYGNSDGPGTSFFRNRKLWIEVV